MFFSIKLSITQVKHSTIFYPSSKRECFIVVTKPNTRSGDAIYQLASDGIDYLDGRTHFWRQQEPLYARKSLKKADNNDETYKYVHRELEAIDECKSTSFLSSDKTVLHL